MNMIELLTADQLARQLKRSLRTLHRWRTETGTGPTALKIAGRWYYRRDETEQFIRAAWLEGFHRWPGLAGQGDDHESEPEVGAVVQVVPAAPAEVVHRAAQHAAAPLSLAAIQRQDAAARAALDAYRQVNEAERGIQ
jgi:hypothetical protein